MLVGFYHSQAVGRRPILCEDNCVVAFYASVDLGVVKKQIK